MTPLPRSNLSFALILKVVFGLVLGTLVIGYAIFQARNLLMGPEVTLTEDLGTIQHDRTILLEGTTKNIVSMTLNGKEIHTNEAGKFAERLVLENGYTIMTLHAQDRYGRTSTLTKKFVYEPS